MHAPSSALLLRLLAILAVATLVAAACGGDSSGDPSSSGVVAPSTTPVPEEPDQAPADEDEPTDEPTDEAVTAATFTLRPSVNQLHVLEAPPGADALLVAADGTESTGAIDEQGSLLWRDIAAGQYMVSVDGTTAGPVAVADITDPPPGPDFYADQTIGEGFGYITTRDGTTLSATVWLPGPAEDGPYPTVVEYSGYQPSDPESGGSPLIYGTLGYAYVGINMRGTGCSGGSFEYFEPMQLLDGYDAVEAIAAQPWVQGNRVGMVGISYPGISQLFVASTQPPSLAAITPLSVLDDSTRSTLYPGGILNTGFAAEWSAEREADAEPYGQGWEQRMVDAGDTICEANQLVRLQNTPADELIEQNPFYDPELADPITPALLVDQINVPVFLAGAWQDEQTGGRFPVMLDRFTSSPALYATMMNGSHTESLANAAVFERYVEFLDLYVAEVVPDGASAATVATLLTSQITGVSVAPPAGPRFADLSYDEALAAFEAEAGIRILFEDGAADGAPPGSTLPRYEAAFPAWPVQGQTTAWYLGADGVLTDEPATATDATTSYTSDPDNVPDTFYTGDGNAIWQADTTYEWLPIPTGTGAEWASAPLADDTVIIGSGSLDLWIQSTADDTDLEVTVVEVRPDGTEVYVQSGWLRTSRRALDPDESSELRPVHTQLEADAAPLPAGEFTEVRVEIFPFAHAFRAGSQLKVTVDAPGGARPVWAFDTTIAAGETNTIAHDAQHPSRLVLNVVDGIDVPAGYPECGALRSQPCR